MLAGILVLAVFLRFYKLDVLPPGLHPDEAANGLDVFRIFSGDIRPLYNTNGPRESLFFFLQALFVGIMGNSILALRMAPAFIGSLAVLTTYLWVKTWFGRRAGLIAGFLMAVTPWAITMSRIGFRASMVPLVITLTLWLFTRGLQTAKRSWFVLAGLSMGAGLYTYISYRFFIFLLIGMGILLLIWKRQFVKKWWPNIRISLIVASIVVLPLALFALKDPSGVLGTRSSTSFLNPELNKGKPLTTLTDTVVKTGLMFNVHGDENNRHNLGGAPQLNFVVGFLFLVGVLICLSKLNHPKYLMTLGLFGAMLMPEVLTAEGIPHALRAIGALPIAIALAAVGLNFGLTQWGKAFKSKSAHHAVVGLVALVLATSAYQGYRQYFVDWANSPATYRAYSEDAVRIAEFINTNKFNGERYGVFEGYSNITVLYLTHNKASVPQIQPDAIAQIKDDGQPKQFIMSYDFRRQALPILEAKYPNGQLKAYYSDFSGTELFSTYEVAGE